MEAPPRRRHRVGGPPASHVTVRGQGASGEATQARRPEGSGRPSRDRRSASSRGGRHHRSRRLRRRARHSRCCRCRRCRCRRPRCRLVPTVRRRERRQRGVHPASSVGAARRSLLDCHRATTGRRLERGARRQTMPRRPLPSQMAAPRRYLCDCSSRRGWRLRLPHHRLRPWRSRSRAGLGEGGGGRTGGAKPWSGPRRTTGARPARIQRRASLPSAARQRAAGHRQRLQRRRVRASARRAPVERGMRQREPRAPIGRGLRARRRAPRSVPVRQRQPSRNSAVPPSAPCSRTAASHSGPHMSSRPPPRARRSRRRAPRPHRPWMIRTTAAPTPAAVWRRPRRWRLLRGAPIATRRAAAGASTATR